MVASLSRSCSLAWHLSWGTCICTSSLQHRSIRPLAIDTRERESTSHARPVHPVAAQPGRRIIFSASRDALFRRAPTSHAVCHASPSLPFSLSLILLGEILTAAAFLGLETSSNSPTLNSDSKNSRYRILNIN